jgi:hypothetical protein
VELNERRAFSVCDRVFGSRTSTAMFGELLHWLAGSCERRVDDESLTDREKELVKSVIDKRDAPPSSRVRRSDLEQAVIRAAMALADADLTVGIQEEALVAHLRATVNELRRGGV